MFYTALSQKCQEGEQTFPCPLEATPSLARPGVDIPCAGAGVPVMIETGASPLHQHRIPAHPAHRRLIIGVSDSRLSWNRLWASPRPPRPPRYLWSTPVPTPRALKPLVVVHSVHTSSLVQVGALTCARGPRSSKWGPAAQICSGRLSAGRGGHRTESGAPVFLREP